MVQGARDFARYSQRVVEWKLSLAIQPCTQRLSRDVRHHIVKLAVRFPGVVDGKDVGMTEVRCEIDLASEALRPQSEPDIGEEHLDRDLPVVLEVAREVHGSHGPVTELALDLVAGSDGCAQPFEGGGHIPRRMYGTAGQLYECLPVAARHMSRWWEGGTMPHIDAPAPHVPMAALWGRQRVG